MKLKQFEMLEERVTFLVGVVKEIKEENNGLIAKVMELEEQIISINEDHKEHLTAFSEEKVRFLEEITNLKRERDIIQNKVSIMLEKIEGIKADQ